MSNEELIVKEVLRGKVSPETAYSVFGYPWGFRLKTEKRYWIETTKYGQREVSQTRDPRTSKWCKPKKGLYADVQTLFLDEKGYVQCQGLMAAWTDEEKIDAWVAKFGTDGEYQKNKVIWMKAIDRARKYVTVSVVPAGQGNSPEENDRIRKNLGQIVASEVLKMGGTL